MSRLSAASEDLIFDLCRHAGAMADALEDLLFTDTTPEDLEQFKAVWQGYVDFADQVMAKAWGKEASWRRDRRGGSEHAG